MKTVDLNGISEFEKSSAACGSIRFTSMSIIGKKNIQTDRN